MFEKFDAKAREILSKMTLREKIGQLNQTTIAFYKGKEDELFELVRRGEVGSFVMSTTATGGNDAQERVNRELYRKIQKIAVEESRTGIPVLYGRDVIHGHKTVLPVPIGSAAAFNDELVEKCYRDIAEEAKAEGIHWTFSPMLDMCHDPRWGRMVEGPGEDPFVGASLARAAIKGFQGDDLSDPKSIAACAKHYIGYGASEGGRDYHRAEISDISLQNYYLPAFRAAVDAGVATVMSSFNDINGIPVASSKKYLDDILRGQLGFDGFVVSDWGAVSNAIRMGYIEDRRECAKLGLIAGNEIDMCSNCFVDHLEALVNDGELDVEYIDRAVLRVLRVKLAIGLFDRPFGTEIECDYEAHRKNARALSAESLVLLKNNGVLPLKKDVIAGLVGPFTFEREALLGTWVLDGKPHETTNMCEALSEVLPKGNLKVAERLTLYDNSTRIAMMSDVVIVALGENHMSTGELQSVYDISISDDQKKLIDDMRSYGKKVVGVFFCARPRVLDGLMEKFDAVIWAWHTGSEAAHAVCDVLFGDVVPSGKLPATLPRRSGHIPIYYNVYASSHDTDNYYDIASHPNYIDGLASPLFPFGFGLSYTEFEYKNLTVDREEIPLDAVKNGEKVRFSIDVENVGEFDGKEVVQLYIRDRFASIMRPIRELKGYKKVFIEKGKTAKVEFELGFKDLGFYNGEGEYLVEKGLFEVYIGENCLTKNKVTFNIV